MSNQENKRNNTWYLLPIFLGFIGGIIAFFMIRQDDPSKAKNCLYLGIALTVASIVMSLIMTAIIPDLRTAFVNV